MPSPLSTLGALTLGAMESSLAVRVLLSITILVVGLLLARLAAHLTRRSWEQQLEERELVEKMKGRQRAPDRLVQYVFIVITLIIAMIPINAAVAEQLAAQIVNAIPSVMTTIFVFFLGVILVNGLMWVTRALITNLELRQHVDTVGMSPRVLDAFLIGVKLLLYLVVLEFAIVQLGVSPQIINNTVVAASYGVVAIVVLLGFFGFKDLIQNYAAGIYLRGSDVLTPGKKVKLGDESGEIRDISLFGTTIVTDSGYFMLSPNKELMKKDILFRRVKADIETLEDIKNYFVAQDPALCGPASAEMALAMFGYDIEQDAVHAAVEEGSVQQQTLSDDADADLDRSKTLDPLVPAVEQLTDGEVQGAFIEHDRITSLPRELKAWFNDGGLVVARFSQPALFPKTEHTEHHALLVGAEDDELLVVDPSAGTAAGGVYLVDSAELMNAMAEYEGEPGYTVLAPEGTTAYWRITEGLIYSDKGYYTDLSKTLEVRLRKILREGRLLKDVMPAAVKTYVEKWRNEPESRVKQLWTADRRTGDDSETGSAD